MRVAIPLPHPSIALRRIRDALVRYAPPSVEVVPDAHASIHSTVDAHAAADLTILLVIGRCDQIGRLARAMQRRGQRYAVVQVCLRSTKAPHTRDWRAVWDGADAVWSTYNLRALCDEDGEPVPPGFYHAPFGADADVFTPPDDPQAPRRYLALAAGGSWLTESVREVVLAARAVGGCPFVLGPSMARAGPTPWGASLTDAQLAAVYRECWYVSGLRRVEGFELPAAEGLLCGARPVLFDQPHYRAWYRGLAVFIQEGPRPQVIEQLRAVFSTGPRPVTAADRADAARRFDWARICGGFWERVM